MSKMDKPEEKQTTVEEGTQFKGTLQSTCRVMVRGVVDGDLTAPAVIMLTGKKPIGIWPRENSSHSRHMSTAPPPDPPYSSGIATPSQPTSSRPSPPVMKRWPCRSLKKRTQPVIACWFPST